MSFNVSINKLEYILIEFSKWKENNPHRHIPKQLWNFALDLTSEYSLKEIAKAVGYPPSYLNSKLAKRLKPVQPAMP